MVEGHTAHPERESECVYKDKEKALVRLRKHLLVEYACIHVHKQTKRSVSGQSTTVRHKLNLHLE